MSEEILEGGFEDTDHEKGRLGGVRRLMVLIVMEDGKDVKSLSTFSDEYDVNHWNLQKIL